MKNGQLNLLKQLCAVRAASSCEATMKKYLLHYIESHQSSWAVRPTVIHGEDFQDCVILIFGKPTAAIYAHMDSVGYTVGYHNELLKIGSPRAEEGTELIGEDSKGKIKGTLHYKIEDESDEGKRIKSEILFHRKIDRGTTLTYQPNFNETSTHIQNCYLDNRLGMWVALKTAETLRNGAIVFSAWEEVGGGSVGYLGKFLYEKYRIRQALIADITWVTDGVKAGAGVAISMRDSGMPRKSYVDKIIQLAKKSGIQFQLEVESAGGSDGNALQKAPYPIDWCFVGAPEENVHMPTEKVHKEDIKSMLALYQYLMLHL